MNGDAGVFVIPENECSFDFMRASGKGGQNVNKVETKVRLHWAFESSQILSPEQKGLVREQLAKFMNAAGELVVESQRYRGQAENRADAVVRLEDMVSHALRPRKKRVATRPTRASRERRLEDKSVRSTKKQRRKPIGAGDQ